MLRFIILISCLIGVAFSGCSSGSCGSSKSGKGCSGGSSSCGGGSSSGKSCGGGGGGCGRRSLTGHVSNSENFGDYDYDIIPMPDGVGTIGIMDSPFYDCKSKSLFFVDLFKQNIYRYSEELNQVFYCSVPGFATPSFFIKVRGQDNIFVMGQNQTVYTVQWDGFSTVCNIVGTVTSAEQGTIHHTNAAIAGPTGVLYYGFFSQNLCADPPNQGLYRWSNKRGQERLPGSYVTVNSMAFDYERNILYFSDGCNHIIRGVKINKKTGKMSQPYVVFNNFGLPSSAANVGISVDIDGNLVVGSYKGGTVFFINTITGQLMKIVHMPTLFTAAVAYGGGCSFDKLYVMTAQLDADITTGQPTNNTVAPPGGSLLVFHGLGRGQQQLRKPCIAGC